MTVVTRRYSTSNGRQQPSGGSGSIDRDVDTIIWSMGLHGIRRYYRQRFWEKETQASEFAERIETFPRLESVAEHSWHTGYICMLLSPRYHELDVGKVMCIATLHDILEIISGDDDPLGRDGTGQSTHAFNDEVARQRALSEKHVLSKYLNMLPPDAREEQRSFLDEYLDVGSPEAKFVKSVDKMQTLVFVMLKKSGNIDDRHLRFTLNYSEKGISYFPALEDHFRNLQGRILSQVAEARRTSVEQLRKQLFGSQLSFW